MVSGRVIKPKYLNDCLLLRYYLWLVVQRRECNACKDLLQARNCSNHRCWNETFQVLPCFVTWWECRCSDEAGLKWSVRYWCFSSSFNSITSALSLSQDPFAACIILPRLICPSKLWVVRDSGVSVCSPDMVVVVSSWDIEGSPVVIAEKVVIDDELGSPASDSESRSCVLGSHLHVICFS